MLSAKQSALDTAGPCQSPELLASSSPYSRFLTRLRLLAWYMERDGLFGELRRTAIALVPGLRAGQRKTARRTTVRNQRALINAVSVLVVNSFHFKAV